jgi:RNA 3'-terminal phosphate cyclase (ATP)
MRSRSSAASKGLGNTLVFEIECEHTTAVSRLANAVVQRKVLGPGRSQGWLNAKVPVDDYLADQLLLPMALAGGFVPRLPSSFHTNAAVIQRFLPVPIQFQQGTDFGWNVIVGKLWAASTSQQAVSRSNP